VKKINVILYGEGKDVPLDGPMTVADLYRRAFGQSFETDRYCYFLDGRPVEATVVVGDKDLALVALVDTSFSIAG